MAENMITLTQAQYDALTHGAGTPSPYEVDVRKATPEGRYAVAISDAMSSRTITNQLHKAAKAAGVKLQVNVREKAVSPASPNGLVAWCLLPAPVADAASE